MDSLVPIASAKSSVPKVCQACPPSGCSGVMHVPVEILEYIFAWVSPYKDLDNCAASCRLWRDTVRRIREKQLWAFPSFIAKERLLWHVLLKEQESAQKTVEKPSFITARYAHASCIVGDNLYIFGGLSSLSTGFNDLWRLNLTDRRWHRCYTTGMHPLPKGGATLVRIDDKLVLFGGSLHGMTRDRFDGFGGPSQFCEYHLMDLETCKWTVHNATATCPTPAPTMPLTSATSSSAFAADPRYPLPVHEQYRVYIERLHAGREDDVPPSALCFHSATVHNGEMVVFGGQSAINTLQAQFLHDEVWCLDLETNKWRKPVFDAPAGAATAHMRRRRTLSRQRDWPGPRCRQSQVKLDENHALIIGGFGGPNQVFNDVWLLEIGSKDGSKKWKWSKVTLENPSPAGVSSRPFAKVGNYVVALGPCNGCGRRTSPLFIERLIAMNDSEGGPLSVRNPGANSGQQNIANIFLVNPSASSAASVEERNINGRFGQLRRASASAASSSSGSSSSGAGPSSSAAAFAVSSPLFCDVGGSSPPKRCFTSSLRPNAAKNAQLRLENLKKYEQRMMMLGHWPAALDRQLALAIPKPPKRGTVELVTSDNSSTVLHMLDVSRVISEKKAKWLESSDHGRCSPGPSYAPFYSFHCGRMNEFVVFGGLLSKGENFEPTDDVYFGSMPPDYAP